MITRELVKAKIDTVQEEYLDLLYGIVQSLESGWSLETTLSRSQSDTNSASEGWLGFIARAYGSTAAAPLERGEQGSFEMREVFERSICSTPTPAFVF